MPPYTIVDSGLVGCPASVESSKHAELESKELREIRQALPDSTPAERSRFLADRRGDTKAAIEKLRNYLEWRSKQCDDDLNHLDPWTFATQMANRISNESRVDDTLKLPCPVFMQEHTRTSVNHKGEKVITKEKYIQFLPARIDVNLADTSIYAEALCIYIDRVLDRNTTEQMTILCDTRPGYGWANISPFNMIPFMKNSIRLLSDMHPRRLRSCIAGPIISIASVLWKAVKPFLGRDTVEKVHVLYGPSKEDDKMPKKLSKHLDEDLIIYFEERRRSLFS